jgi:ABC-type nitrate/sulfonate/bicarbonate transport system substrate-binding protein
MNVIALRALAVVAVLGLATPPASAADPVDVTIALIPSESAAQAYYAQDLGYFKAAGLNVTLTPMAASPPIISAVASGSPFSASAADDAVSIAPIDDFVAKRFLATGWIASDAWLAAHPDVAQKFAAVMKQTADWANAHHAESAAILLKYTKMTPDVVARMQRATYGTSLDPGLLQPVIDNAAKYGSFPRPVTAAELTWSK